VCWQRLPAIVAAAPATTTAAATTTATAATTPAAAAATTTAVTSAAPAATTATATTAAPLALLRFVDAERATVEERAVHLVDRFLSFGFGAHRDEREPAGLARLAIGRDVDIADFAERSECGADRVRRRVERQITYVETVSHFFARFVRGS
jgi:hypothetical protein